MEIYPVAVGQSPCIMCSVPWGGYHDKCGGICWVLWGGGGLVPWGTQITKDCSPPVQNIPRYSWYPSTCIMIIPTVLKISPQYWKPPTVLNTHYTECQSERNKFPCDRMTTIVTMGATTKKLPFDKLEHWLKIMKYVLRSFIVITSY